MPINQKHLVSFGVVALLALTFLLYSQTLKFDFVNWDDDVYVYDNLRAHEFSLATIWWFFVNPYFNSYTPVTLLSHVVDIAVWGLKPAGHHLTNVVLHTCNTFWVFLLCLQLMKLVRGAREVENTQRSERLLSCLFAATLFAWHPLRVESVAWVSDRKDLLCLFFLLPSVLSYLASRQAGIPAERLLWYVISLILFLLACLAKSVAVTLPLVLLLLDWAVMKREGLVPLVKEKLPFLVVSMAMAGAAIAVSPPATGSDIFDIFSPLQRVLLPFYNIMFYLGKTVVPMTLSPIYPPAKEATMAVAFALFVIISLGTLRALKKGHRLLVAAWTAYVVLLLPSSVALQAVMQTAADRYTYLASVVVAIAAGLGTYTLMQRLSRTLERRIVISALIAVAAFLAFLNVRQQPVWTNSVTLWNRAIALYPTMPLPHNNLGLALQSRGEIQRAQEEYTRAIELKPDYVEAHVNLGNIYFITGKWKDAERLFLRAMELAPHRAEVYNNLGIVANVQGKTLEALDWLRQSVRVDSTYAQGHFNLGTLYAAMGNTAAAMEAFQRAARLGHRKAQQRLLQEGVQW